MSDSPTKVNEELFEIDIDLIEPNSLQPRTKFDEAQLEELAQSIISNGIIQPLLVRPINGGQYQIVAGERRWRAAQRANLQKVPCVVREIPDDKVLELALIENIQRQELNAIEEAHAYKRLIETLGLTQETLAQRVGRDRTFITNYLRLLRLPEEIQHFVEEGKITMGHARALLGIDDAAIQLKVANSVITQGLSVRNTEKAIKQIVAGKGNPFSTNRVTQSSDANVKVAEDKLRRQLGTKVRVLINEGDSKGKIEIEFYDINDLDRIYQIIMRSQEDKTAT